MRQCLEIVYGYTLARTHRYTHMCACVNLHSCGGLCAKMAAIQKQCPSEALVLKRDWRMGGREKKKDEKRNGGRQRGGRHG